MSRSFRPAPAAGRRILVAAAVAASCAMSLSAGARELPNFDALSRSPVSAAATPAASALAIASPRAQIEPRLGVPKFLWGREVDATLAAMARAPAARKTAVAGDADNARGLLRDVADLYRMTPAEVDALAVTHVAKLPDGGSLTRFRNDIDGIEVWREQVNVLVDKRGALVAVGGFALGAPATRAVATAESRTQAVALALTEQGFAASAAGSLVRMREESGYQWLTLPDGSTGADGVTLAAPLRVKRVWYRLPDALVPAWYVEIQVNDKTSAHGTDAYSYVVSATDGALLFRNSLVTDAAFTYRVYAESTPPFLPLPGPGGRGGFPHPTGQPDGYQPPIQPRNLVTLQNAPFSRNDPWLNDIANRTTGNNVEAFTNMLEGDGFGTPGTDECNINLPVDGDLHACVTGPNTFDHAYDHGLPPNANRSQVGAVVTNLFYTINYLHDFFYDAGFDEVAGNAQANNYNRGGAGNDSIYAEAQDYTGSNNANMFTPPDGQRPRMRMFLWNSTLSLAKVDAPASLAGVKLSNTGEFGPQAFDLTGTVVQALDAANPDGPTTTDGCSPFTNAPAVAGKIALVDRGTCTFVVKAKNAQDAGAAALLVVNNVTPGAPGMAGTDPIAIPALSVTLDDGAAIKAKLAEGVSMRLARQSALPRDGSLDNTVVAHEWGHYLSNRLVNNANGLVANQSRGMGEGYSDFVAMLLLVKEEDRNVPANANFNGTYPDTPYPYGGPDFAPDVLNNAYYYGLRRYPYTRDMTKNPLTFRHIADDQPLPATPPMSPRASTSVNSEVHNTGEVWASMLWECYSNLLNDTGRLTFTQAQDRMKRYLVASFKLMPSDPSFIVGRDALLAAMQAQDPQDHDLCLAGFAKRGIGVGAVAPNNLSEDNIGVVESFRSGAADPGVKAVAIEYYHAAFDHYFITSIAGEITKLDNGTFVGWARTGESFNVYADAPLGASAVCRFFSTAFGPKSSHFYTPSAAECATVKANPNWGFEGEVFTVPTPDAAGNCAAGTVPVYRLYNDGQGAAPNHRYTTSLVTRTKMIGSKWIPEGYGPLGVVMCSPQ